MIYTLWREINKLTVSMLHGPRDEHTHPHPPAIAPTPMLRTQASG
jgi:hypothetical protein